MNRISLRSIVRFVWRRVVSLVEIGVLCCVAATAVSWFASVWWIADIAAQFRVQCAFGIVVGVIYLSCRRFWKRLALLVPLLVWCVVPILFSPTERVPFSSTERKNGEIRLLVFNVLTSNRNYEGVLSYLEEMDPDVIGLLEIDSSWDRELIPLEKRFPEVKKVIREDNFGLCFYSRLPVEKVTVVPSDPAGIPSFDISFAGNYGDLRLVLTHPVPPVSEEASELRNYQLEKYSSRLGEYDGPCLLAGDLNLTPWTPAFSKMLETGDLRNSAAGLGITPTWRPYPTFFGGLLIDHILHNKMIEVRGRSVGPDLGSDHRPVLIDFLVKWESE